MIYAVLYWYVFGSRFLKLNAFIEQKSTSTITIEILQEHVIQINEVFISNTRKYTP